MKPIVAPSFETMSAHAADALFALLHSLREPLICTASGASPAGLYRELVKRVKSDGTDISSWRFVGLDEWAGMNGGDAGSSRHQLDEQLFFPLGVGEDQICFFDGRAADPEDECRRVDAFVRQRGGIDVAILGIGVNGHIAMNEPGTDPSLRTHVADIHPETQRIGQKYFAEPRPLDKGLTMGLAALLEAPHIFLLASGAGKAAIIGRMRTEPAGRELPATLLRDHPGLRLYLDTEAASMAAGGTF